MSRDKQPPQSAPQNAPRPAAWPTDWPSAWPSVWPSVWPSAWKVTDKGAPASEEDILALIDMLFASRTDHVPLGRGHDCAELALNGRDLALSTDLFLEDAHFRTAYFTPEEAGAKALSAAVSDLAAAGAAPLGFSLGLALPGGMAVSSLHALLKGMAVKAAEFGLALSGGDLTRAAKLGLALTVWGKAVDPGCPFLRRGRARPEHCIFLVGRAGLARVGLWALEREGRQALASWPLACAAHLAPAPLLAEGQALARLAWHEARKAAEKGRAAPRFSLMDVSDGLVRDLPRLLGGLGADLDFEPGIIPEETAKAAPLMGLLPEELFLLGGEDYSLAGACAKRMWPRVQQAVPEARLLGTVKSAPGLSLRGRDLALEGFDHFSARRAAPPKGRHLPARALAAAKDIMRTGREAWQAGLMAGFNGNISCRVRLDDGREACLITRSGAAKARLDFEDFALLSLPGGEILAGAAPSSESPVHTGIYAACPQSRCVLHIHPPALLAASLAFAEKERLDLPLPEAAAYGKRLAWTPFFPPGSDELGQAVAGAAEHHEAVFMERHGLVIHGPNLDAALALAEELEQLAKMRLMVQKK